MVSELGEGPRKEQTRYGGGKGERAIEREKKEIEDREPYIL